MLTSQQYSQRITNASQANALQFQALLNQYKAGGTPDFSQNQCFGLKITNARRCLAQGDVSSDNAVQLYNDLQSITGAGNASINTNTQLPVNTAIVYVNPVGRVNTGDVPFVNSPSSPGFTLTDWQNNYYTDYGNKPVFSLLLNTGGLTQDEQTPPTYNYTVPNDTTSPLLSVSWDFPPVELSGFIRIVGQRQG